MMKRTCIQCGKEFEISQSEIAFFKKKKLSLPKRCKKCRENNKQNKSIKAEMTAPKSGEEVSEVQSMRSAGKAQERQRAEETWKALKSRKVQQAGNVQKNEGMQEPEKIQKTAEKKKTGGRQKLAYLAAALIIGLSGAGAALHGMNSAEPVETKQEQILETEENSQTEVSVAYEFRNQELLENHYKKHGIEMGFASEEEYLAGANRVIASPDVLQKTEAEDGDDVYYLEATNEFVVVSKDGYLRTYFYPSDGIEYYNRQ